jgi:hypothetical protein
MVCGVLCTAFFGALFLHLNKYGCDSTIQHVTLCDFFCLNSSDLNKGPENSNHIFVSFGTWGPTSVLTYKSASGNM